jgi:hypothetical protein
MQHFINWAAVPSRSRKLWGSLHQMPKIQLIIMENFMGLALGIGYGYFLGKYWATRQFTKVENIEVVDPEVVEAPEANNQFTGMMFFLNAKDFNSQDHGKN